MPENHTHKDGRVFEFVREETYATRSGEVKPLYVWRTKCRRDDCDGDVVVTTPATGYATSSAFGLVHCPDHRLTRAEARKHWKDAVKRGTQAYKARLLAEGKAHPVPNRILSDDDVAEIRRLLDEGFKAVDIALVYPVKVRTIYAIKQRTRR